MLKGIKIIKPANEEGSNIEKVDDKVNKPNLPPHLQKKDKAEKDKEIKSSKENDELDKTHSYKTEKNKEKDIKDTVSEKADREVKYLNKKRKPPSEDEMLNKRFVENKRHKEEFYDFEKGIKSAIDCFTANDNEGFYNLFNKLEVYKTSKSNRVGYDPNERKPYKEFESVKEEMEVGENAPQVVSLRGMEDGMVEGEIDDYLEDPELRSVRHEIENQNYVNNNIKKELLQLKTFSEFEKQTGDEKFIVKKDLEDEIDLEVLKKTKKDLFKEEKSAKNKEKRRLTVLSSCLRCFGAKLVDHSVISQSGFVYMAYPYEDGSITDFHVILSSKEHVNSLAGADESVYVEIRNYMKSIVAYNLESDYSTVFLEHSLQIDKMNHFQLDCIPIKHKLLSDAKLYFKKGLQDQDTEWSSNKKFVDTTKYKGNMTKILNEKFSYIHVDFNAEGGILHVIEDETKFSKTFLKEILSPLLKKDLSFIKYPPRIGLRELIDTAEEYRNKFSKFDWVNYT